ncbi:unnamed protein product [Rotaria sp. Silwood1]|nr:unnamed protein product [Rotaria sp. Silwood1]CAF1685939.1 unnamed protein product [Rotaria sp. Silwood1]
MLSHDTLHSKQVIKIQGLIKHYDSLLASGHEPETHTLAALEPVLYDFFSFIVNSVRIEDDKWKRLSRQIVDLLLAHLQSQDQSLLDIYPTQLTLFDVVSSVALRSIDPFVVAFRALLQVINFFCEGIHLDESGLLLVLLIEQFLPLPLYKQLLPKYLPLIL